MQLNLDFSLPWHPEHFRLFIGQLGSLKYIGSSCLMGFWHAIHFQIWIALRPELTQFEQIRFSIGQLGLSLYILSSFPIKQEQTEHFHRLSTSDLPQHPQQLLHLSSSCWQKGFSWEICWEQREHFLLSLVPAVSCFFEDKNFFQEYFCFLEGEIFGAKGYKSWPAQILHFFNSLGMVELVCV